VHVTGRLGKLPKSAHPVRFSDVHVVGILSRLCNSVSPVRLIEVSFVLPRLTLVSPVGKVGSVVSNGQNKTTLKVRVGTPTILVSPAPSIINDVDNPVHPVRFSVVHVSGRVGNDVNPVSPDRSTVISLVLSRIKVVSPLGKVGSVVSLVLLRFKRVSPVGKVGSVVSDVQLDRFKLKVLDGNPTIVVIRAPTIVNVVGRPLHPARLSDVTPAGMVGKDVSDEQFVRFIDLADCGNPLPTLFNLVHPVRSMVANIVELEKNIDVNVEGSP
jgi:hypothetical protein